MSGYRILAKTDNEFQVQERRVFGDYDGLGWRWVNSEKPSGKKLLGFIPLSTKARFDTIDEAKGYIAEKLEAKLAKQDTVVFEV